MNKKNTKNTKKSESESEGAEENDDDHISLADDSVEEVTGETHTELFCRNLSFKSTEDSLHEAFSKFGPVENVKVLTDKMTGKPKGIAFVKFEKRADAKKAMEEVGDIDGRTPTCTWSNEKPERGPQKTFDRPPRDNDRRGESRDTGSSGPTHTVFVGNLGFKTNDYSIKNFFSKVGNVVNVRIAKHEDGKAKGFCHVDFDTKEAAEAAVGLAGQNLDGRDIRVDMSEPRKGGFGGGAPRGRGGFGGGRGGNRGGFGGGRGGRGGFNSKPSYGGNSRGGDFGNKKRRFDD